MPPAGFEPTVPASERPQTHALHRAATGTGNITLVNWKYLMQNGNKNMNEPKILLQYFIYFQTNLFLIQITRKIFCFDAK